MSCTRVDGQTTGSQQFSNQSKFNNKKILACYLRVLLCCLIKPNFHRYSRLKNELRSWELNVFRRKIGFILKNFQLENVPTSFVIKVSKYVRKKMLKVLKRFFFYNIMRSTYNSILICEVWLVLILLNYILFVRLGTFLFLLFNSFYK